MFITMLPDGIDTYVTPPTNKVLLSTIGVVRIKFMQCCLPWMYVPLIIPWRRFGSKSTNLGPGGGKSLPERRGLGLLR